MSTRLTLTLALLLTAPAAVAQTPAAPAGTIEYYHVDALGSVRAVTTASGAVVRTYHYHPFGEGVGVEAGTDPMRFTGKPRDGETGLDYFGVRYYAPRTGRFTSVDPLLGTPLALRDPQRWNRYVYVGNRPTRLVDPDGRGWLSKVVKLVINGGNLTATLADVADNASTVMDPFASGGERVGAGARLLSEALPVSIGDVKAGISFAARQGGDALGFTRSTFRRNLGRLTGEIPNGAHAHHVLPLKFKDRFERAGLNVNDPRFGSWWEVQGHLRNAKGYNEAWDAFFRKSPEATRDQIVDFGKQLASRYGIKVNY